jgi:hypothetical protein
MARSTVDWNYDRIHTAQAQITDCQNDMMRCLYRGEVSDVVRERMCQRLRDATDDIQRLKLCHEPGQ